MPRQVAPPPSGEFNVKLSKPFSGTPTQVIEITGEPNRPATITRSDKSQAGNEVMKTGQMGKEDVQELLSLVSSVRGFPSSTENDIFGLDAKLDLTTFDVQWSNDDTDDAAMGTGVKELGDETKDDFKRVVQSIEAAARTFAKQDKAL